MPQDRSIARLSTPTDGCPSPESTTDVISGIYGGERHELIYAVFTTPSNSIPGSAVCAFSMRSILDAFEGAFKEQETMNSNWLPVRPTVVRRAALSLPHIVFRSHIMPGIIFILHKLVEVNNSY